MQKQTRLLPWSVARGRLLLFVLVVMGAALAINTTITAKRAYHDVEASLQHSSRTSVDLLSHALSGLLRNFQREEARRLLNEFTAREQFVSARILSHDGRELVRAGDDAGDRVGTFEVSNPVLDRDGNSLGVLEVMVSEDIISVQVRNAIVRDSIIGAALILGILFIVYMGTSRMVSAIGDAHDEMRRQAQHDMLTGLLNRRGVRQAVLERFESGEDVRLALVHVDLDRFKVVNDSLGHATGDRVLSAFAKRLRGACRPWDLLARIGGDEFLVVRELNEYHRDMSEFARYLVEILNEPLPPAVSRINVGASAGVHALPCRSIEDFDHAVADADLALYEAKKLGRGQYVIYQEDMRSNFIGLERMLHDMRGAVERSEFEPWFQPQIDTDTGDLYGVEALVRWESPERGVLTPADFLKLSEEINLLRRIDSSVFKKATAYLADLRRKGLSDVRLSFNLSTPRLDDPELTSRLIEDIEAVGLEVSDVSLEVLETVVFDTAHEPEVQAVRKLAEAGFQIELDDFGTGRASIANLTKFPIGMLKIDRLFISGIDQDTSKQKIVRAVLGLADEFGIGTIAEGVETEAEYRVLRDMGCVIMQGYYFAKPMSFEALQSWYMTRAEDRVDEFVALHGGTRTMAVSAAVAD